ncbi:MAG: shikimate dehydrogenase [Pyrinomonadaceae bacterium]
MNNGKICISVCAQTAGEMIAKIGRAEQFADVIEVRFDCLQPEQIDVLSSQIEHSEFAKPLLATFRSPEQGGKNTLSQDERVAFWRKPQTKFWAADVEEDVFDAAADWPNRIVSFHDFDKAPKDLASICERLFSHDSGIVKIAVRADDITDSISVWNLIENAAGANKLIIPVAIGEGGKWTRVLGLAHDACMTYASLDEGEKTADGQIAVRDLIEVYRVKELDKNTAVYGIIGDPVLSSLSPYMHNPAFTASGINAVFLPLLVKNLDEFIRRMVAPAMREVELNFAGFSVTMPHKQTIMKHLDEIDAVAAKIGAVNTVKIADGKLIGYNTDAHGFITPLKTKFGDLKNARVAVFGAGGAARACVYALTLEGAEVTVLARDLQRANSFADEFNVKVAQLTTDHRPLTTDIVVNATPLGMKGAFENESPLTAEQLEGVRFVYDLVTRADDTPLVREANKAGIPAIGGLEMLIAQGVKQFEIWTGRNAPVELMRLSVTARLSK